MLNHFMSIVEEIQLEISRCEEESLVERLERRLGAFRLPILLFNSNDPGKSIKNAYFDMVFSSLDALLQAYPHLLLAPRDVNGNYLSLLFRRLPYEAYVGHVQLCGKWLKLFVIDYRIEYAQLLKSVEKYLLVDLVHNSNDFVGIADEVGNFVYMNEAGLKLLHYNPLDAHLLNVWDLHDHKELKQILEAGAQPNGSFSWVGQVRVRTLEGKWLYCSQSITSHIAGGKRYYATTLRDMTSLKRIDAQICAASAKVEELVYERSEEIVQLNIQLLHDIEVSERMRYMIMAREAMLSNIVDTAIDAFFILDDNWRILRVNKSFKTLVQGTYRNLEGERFLRLLTRASKQEFSRLVPKVVNEENTFVDLDIVGLNGLITPCVASINKLFDQDSHYKGLYGFIKPKTLDTTPDMSSML